MNIDQQTMLPIGTLLHNGTYRVEQYLSSGGFGNTYVVTNVHLGKQLAMKEFFMKGISQRDDQQTTVSVSNSENQEQFDSQLKKFKKEALRLHDLENENIVRVHDFFEENGTAYYVMDLIDGESLSARMKRLGRPLTETEVMALLPQILNSLKGMHAQQIWHLDLKPGNIMVDRQDHAVLIDFGASKQMDASKGYTGTSSAMCYTPGFAPTEQVDGNIKRIGPWTDFYALGATIYNLLTKQQPPSSSEMVTEGVSAFQFPESVSGEMRQLIVWMMNARPASRPQNVGAIEFRLSQMTSGADATLVHQSTDKGTKPVGNVVPPVKSKSNKGLIIAICGILIGLLLIAGLGIGMLFYFLNRDTSDDDILYEPMEEYTDTSYTEGQSDEDDAYEYDVYDSNESHEIVGDTIFMPVNNKVNDYNRDDDVVEETVMETNGVIEEEVHSAAEDSKVYDVVEQMPQFPGGDAALMSYLSANVHYPVIAEENGIQGRVVCQFVVERDGSISDVRVVRSVDPSLDKEAVRVVKAMPKWTPGKQNGSAVRVKFTLPITFRLN